MTIPKDIRDRFGLTPHTAVEFRVVDDVIVLKKAPRKLELQKWKGYCGKNFAKMGYRSVDEFIGDIRGR